MKMRTSHVSRESVTCDKGHGQKLDFAQNWKWSFSKAFSIFFSCYKRWYMKVHIIPPMAAVTEGGCKNCIWIPITNSTQKFTLHRLFGKLKMTSSLMKEMTFLFHRHWWKKWYFCFIKHDEDMVIEYRSSGVYSMTWFASSQYQPQQQQCTSYLGILTRSRIGARGEVVGETANFHFRNDGQCNGVLAWPDHATMTTFIVSSVAGLEPFSGGEKYRAAQK